MESVNYFLLTYFSKGTESIPGPAEDVHATLVTNNSISLTWSQPDVEGNNNSTETATETAAAATGSVATDDKIITSSTTTTSPLSATTTSSSFPQAATNVDIDFIVQYGKVNNMTMYETVAKLENVSTYYYYYFTTILNTLYFKYIYELYIFIYTYKRACIVNV